MTRTIMPSAVETIIFACEAGMGSSLMSVNSLKKKFKKVNIYTVKVVHKPVREIPQNAQLVIVHKGLTGSARKQAPGAVILIFNHFFNDPVFDKLVDSFVTETAIEDMTGAES